jgi:hypothetical protein
VFQDIVHHGNQGSLGLSPCRRGYDQRIASRTDRTTGLFLDIPEFRPVEPLGKHLLKGFVQ